MIKQLGNALKTNRLTLLDLSLQGLALGIQFDGAPVRHLVHALPCDVVLGLVEGQERAEPRERGEALF